VDLNMKERIKDLAQMICPLMVAGALATQALLIVIMLYSTKLSRPSIGSTRHQEVENGGADQQPVNSGGTLDMSTSVEDNQEQKDDEKPEAMVSIFEYM